MEDGGGGWGSWVRGTKIDLVQSKVVLWATVARRRHLAVAFLQLAPEVGAGPSQKGVPSS